MVGAKKELVAKVAVHAFAALARRPRAQNDPSVAARWCRSAASFCCSDCKLWSTTVHQTPRPNIPARIGLNPNRRARSCKLDICYDAARRLRRVGGPAGRAIEPRALRRGARGPLRV